VIEFLEDDGKDKKEDKKFLNDVKTLVVSVGKNIEKMKPGLAAEQAYNEFWHWFCDVKIEEAKEGKISKKMMIEGLKMMLIMLHPFVPFVTESVWSELGEDKLLITTKWPDEKVPN